MFPQENPLVTVIILPGPAAEVEQSLASVRSQTYSPMELFAPVSVADDEVKSLPTDFNFLRDALPGAGTLVQLLEAGDLLHPQKIGEQVALLAATGADACYGACAYADRAQDEDPPAATFTRDDADFLAAQTGRDLVAVCSALTSRAVITAGRGARRAWEFWRQIAAAGGRFRYHDKVRAFFKRHPNERRPDDEASGLAHAELLARLLVDPADRHCFALAYALAVQVLGPWYLLEEKKGDAVAPRQRGETAAKLFVLLDRLGSDDWLRRDAPGLTQGDRAVLLGHAHYAALREGDRRAATLGVAAGRALAQIAAHDHDPYTPPRLQNLYEIFLRTCKPEIYGPYQEALRRLIYHHIAREKELDNDYRQAVRRLTEAAFQRLAARGARRVGLYGGGLHTSRLLLWIARGLVEIGEMEIVAVADDRPEKQGVFLDGIPIVAPAKLLDLQPDAVLLSSDCFENSLYEKSRPLRDAGIAVERIYGDENPQQHEPVR